MKIRNRSKLQHTSNWVIMILTVITVSIIFNLLVGVTLEKFPLKADLTPNKVLELTKETKSALSTLTRDVHIIVFSTTVTDLPYITEILDRYKRENSKITWEIIDPVRNPSYSSKYSTAGKALMNNSVVVESGNKFRLILPYDIIPPDKEGNIGGSYDAEGMITASIKYVTSDKDIKIGLVVGHGETNIFDGPLGITLKNENIDYQQISLLSNDVPDDFSYLVIAGARNDFAPVEIDRLDKYLVKGKSAQVLYAIDAPALPKLDSFLGEWGIVVNYDLIKEGSTDKIFGNNPNQIIAQYLPSEITNSMIASGTQIVFPMVRSITTKWEEQFGIKIESILMSSNSSYAKANPLSTKEEKEEGDTQGPLNMAVLASRTNIEDNNPKPTGNILVIGTVNLYDVRFIDTNAGLFLNALSSQTRENESVIIKPKSLMSKALSMNMSMIILCSIFVVIIIPLSILFWGLIVWMRRRHL